jgi:PAS domain S-box-containing protein
MNIDNLLQNALLVSRLRKKLKPCLDDYLADDYNGVVVHSSSIIIAANQAVAEMLGYELDELSGMNAWLLFATRSADTLMQHLVDKSEEAYRVIALTKDKKEFEVELKGHDFEIQGDPVRVVLVKQSQDS